MEFQKIVNLFDTTFDDKDLPKFVTKNGLKFMITQKKNYSVNLEIRIKTPKLRSDLCNFSDEHIVVKSVIAVTNPDAAKRNKAVVFKNTTPFINSISKNSGEQIDNAGGLDVVMPVYHLLEYSKNYRKTTERL